MLIALLALLALGASACGGGSDGSTTTSTSGIDLNNPESLDGPTSGDDSGDTGTTGDTGDTGTTGTTGSTGGAKTIDDVAVSTVKITAQGSFVPVGEINAFSTDWNGTGFIINEEGHVVTNNHVVAGSAFLTVTGPGIEGEVNARVLGVAECSDLALIDLEGSGYTPLEFRTEPVNPGLAVFAAGFPGGGGGVEDTTETRDYTVTAGVVSNTTTDGRTPWASVETVIEHDARIRGGNSGGPLVDEQARVVGINFAGADDDFNFAIAAQEAQPIIQQLAEGNIESFGINGSAYVDSEIAGVWVQAVESGSPADGAGLMAGDFILEMEGIPVGTNGTQESYCDIARSHSETDVVSLRVLRLSTGEILTGSLNGDPLGFSFMGAMDDPVDDPDTGTTGDTGNTGSTGATYSAYDVVQSDDGVVQVEVPVEWDARDGSENPNFGSSLWATTGSFDGFPDSLAQPGIIVEATDQLGAGDHDLVLDAWNFSDVCTSSGRNQFTTNDEFYTGLWEAWSDCAGTTTEILTVSAVPVDGRPFLVRMLVVVVSERDLDALDRALGSFDAGFG